MKKSKEKSSRTIDADFEAALDDVFRVQKTEESETETLPDAERLDAIFQKLKLKD